MINPRASNITKQIIFSKITQKQVFEKYLQVDVTELLEGKMFPNPLRNDSFPTCTFKVYKNDSYPEGYLIHFRDWADSKGLDCIGLVQKIANNCSYFDALCLISYHFNLLSDEENKDFRYVLSPDEIKNLLRKNDKGIELLVKRREFTLNDVKYWKQFCLDIEDLEDDVHSLKAYWLNGNRFYPPKDLGFVYTFNGAKKVYNPLADKTKGEMRFIHDNAQVIQGDSKLKYDKRFMIMTSSYKDVKLLRKIQRLYGLDYESAATMSETTPPPRERIDFYKSKYEKVLLYYNNDEAGIKSMNAQANEFDVPIYYNPSNMPKDLTDVAKKDGLQEAVNVVNNILEGLNLPF